MAAGLGGAARLDGIDKTIYCIIGDGELREGQIWEAMDFIPDQQLANVVAIFNCNALGQSDFVSAEQDWQQPAAQGRGLRLDRGWPSTATTPPRSRRRSRNGPRRRRRQAALPHRAHGEGLGRAEP